MKIPKDLPARDSLYHELCAACSVSRNDRKAMYERLRMYYLYGSPPEEEQAPYNKIFPHIDLLTSFTFAAETTRFSVDLGQGVPESELAKTQALAARVLDRWHDSNADLVTGMAVLWSYVFNSTFIKLIQRGRDTLPYMVEPQSFGVLREDAPFLKDQEAFAHFYLVTKSQLEQDLEQVKHPKKDEILATIPTTGRMEEHAAPAGLQRIIISASQPTMLGNVQNPLPYESLYRPRVNADLVDMTELWVWDSSIDDYKIVTLAGTNADFVVFDRDNFFLPRVGDDEPDNPFIQFCPNPTYDYFWGLSEVEGLCRLQDLRNTSMRDVMELIGKAVDPPWALSGWDGLVDEKNFAMRKRGAHLSAPSPAAKVESFAPTVPQDAWAQVREIDAMFAEKSGLGSILQGRGESGVRSRGHAAELARLGSSRAKKKALIIEDSIERMATLYLRCAQRYDPEALFDSEGKSFIAEQFTKNYHMKVDAHSSSPLFVEDLRGEAREMREIGAISNESYLDLVQPPMVQLLKKKLRDMEAAQQKAQAEDKAQEREERALKSVK